MLIRRIWARRRQKKRTTAWIQDEPIDESGSISTGVNRSGVTWEPKLSSKYLGYT